MLRLTKKIYNNKTVLLTIIKAIKTLSRDTKEYLLNS